MKICVLSQRVPFPPNKGEKLRTYHQIKYMIELGHEVSVLSFHETAEDEALAQALASNLNIDVKTVALGSKLRRYLWALAKGLPISVGAFYSNKMQLVIHEAIAQNQIDVMYLTASSLGYYVLPSASQAASPCRFMMDFMDVDSDKWRQYANTSRVPMKWIYEREAKGIRALEQQANQLFANTFLIAQEEVNLFADAVSNARPVQVLGNGLAFDEFYPPAVTPKPEPAEFLFTGVMDYKPNVDAVVWFARQCWPGIKKVLPHARFTIAGMNPVAEVRELAAKDSSIRVTGFVDDILPYFHAATAFVAPFRLARGVQNKVLQAAACGIPIVTTPMGAEGIGFAGTNNMYIVSEPAEFIDACIATSALREEALLKAQRAYADIKASYSWEQQLAPLRVALECL